MGKKKEQMTQIHGGINNEFIFGENGGKGKHLTSFMRSLSLGSNNSNKAQRSSLDYKEINSSIYGSLSYGNGSMVSQNNSGPINSPMTKLPYQNSPASSSSKLALNLLPHNSNDSKDKPSSRASSIHRKKKNNLKRLASQEQERYKDLDADWDADLDDFSNYNTYNAVNANSEARMNKDSRYSSEKAENALLSDPMFPSFPVTVASDQSDVKRDQSLDYEDFKAKLEVTKLNQMNVRYAKFSKILSGESNINIQDLRKLAWNGIPNEMRALSWQILLGYLPTNKSRQISTLKRKRQEYIEGLEMLNSLISFDDTSPSNNSSLSISSVSSTNSASKDRQLYHQIKIDVKRTNPTIKLYGYPETQKALRKVLFLWAVRHPASGYVQGINDLCTPFFQIFLDNYIWQLQRIHSLKNSALEEDYLFIPGLLDSKDELEKGLLEDSNLMNYTAQNINTNKISQRVMSIIEADTYWCLSRLLETITDNYIHEQPGILRQVQELRILISKIDMELLRHLDKEGVEFIQFAFRWMNCLLMRELPMDHIIRMWDTYLSETPLGFNNFHVYVCAAFLIKFSDELKNMDFQDIILFLQNPPTSKWTEKDIELMLSEAFIWQSLYKNASAHLK